MDDLNHFLKAIPCRRCKEFFAPQGDELYCKKCRIKIQRENKKYVINQRENLR